MYRYNTIQLGLLSAKNKPQKQIGKHTDRLTFRLWPKLLNITSLY